MATPTQNRLGLFWYFAPVFNDSIGILFLFNKVIFYMSLIRQQVVLYLNKMTKTLRFTSLSTSYRKFRKIMLIETMIYRLLNKLFWRQINSWLTRLRYILKAIVGWSDPNATCVIRFETIKWFAVFLFYFIQNQSIRWCACI